MIALGVGWGMENLNYKLIMPVKQLNMEVVQFLCGVVWLPMDGLQVQDRGEVDTSFVSCSMPKSYPSYFSF